MYRIKFYKLLFYRGTADSAFQLTRVQELEEKDAEGAKTWWALRAFAPPSGSKVYSYSRENSAYQIETSLNVLLPPQL
jgi:phage gp46-like protein